MSAPAIPDGGALKSCVGGVGVGGGGAAEVAVSLHMVEVVSHKRRRWRRMCTLCVAFGTILLVPPGLSVFVAFATSGIAASVSTGVLTACVMVPFVVRAASWADEKHDEDEDGERNAGTVV